MLKINVSNNMRRYNDVFDENTATLRDVLNQFDIDYEGKNLSIDATSLDADDMDKTLSELGAEDGSRILALKPKNNA